MTITHPDNRLFIEVIVANPDDDTLRLIYADFLSENDDDVKAIFIRRQVAGEPTMVPLMVLTEVEDLMRCQPHQMNRSANGDGCWAYPTDGDLRLYYRRGFLDTVRVPTLATVMQWDGEPSSIPNGEWRRTKWADTLFNKHPTVTQVVVADRTPNGWAEIAYGWIDRPARANAPFFIPTILWDALEEGYELYGRWKDYATATDAINALSTTVCKVVRQLKGSNE